MGKLSVLVINCCLGSLFYGFCCGQMNIIAQDVYEAYGVNDAATKGLLQSLMTVGGAIGAFFSSILLKLFSRKNCLQVTDILSILSISVCFYNQSVHILMFSRFLIGICLGLNGVLVPLYINEMCPPSKAGIMGTLNQLLGTMGILTCFLFGYFKQSQLPIEFYKIILLLPIVPCTLRMLALETLFNYETPVYCNKYSLHDRLTQVLKAIYEPQEMVNYQEQIRLQPKQINHNKGSFQNLLNQRNKKRFMLGCSLAIVQQLGGINGIMFYSSQIFDQLTNHDAAIVYKLNIIVGLIGVFTSILIGSIIERFGRKQILQFGQLLCFISLQLLTILMTMSISETYFGKGLIIFLIFLFLFGFGSSLGPLLFIYLTEILPEQGVSFAAFLNWFCAGLIAQMFPIIASYSINYCFGIFSLFNLAGFILISNYVVETKGLTEIEIQNSFEKGEDIEYTKTPQEEYIN